MLRQTPVASTEKRHSSNPILAISLRKPQFFMSHEVMGKLADGNLSTVQTMTRSRAFENDSDSDTLRELGREAINPKPKPHTRALKGAKGRDVGFRAVLTCLGAAAGAQ